MKIKLKSPFKEKWKYGYLVINKEPRRNVILYNSHQDRTTISYAKYLMSINLGRILEKYEEVDHINGNCMDDRLKNYQILTTKQNIQKMVIDNNLSAVYVEFECGNCEKIFNKEKRKTHLVIKGHKSTYCSRSCAGKASYFGKQSKFIREYQLPKY